jgi:hypothetical protein
MNVDDFLFGLILCGIGLAAACFRSEYLHLRELVGTERRRQKVIRESQLERLSAQTGNREHAARRRGGPDRRHERGAAYDR